MIPTLGILFGAAFLVFGIYGLQVLLLTAVYIGLEREHLPPHPDGALRHVTVQLPVYNEPRVTDRAIAAVCRLRWPRERFDVQVLDDSTDETRELVDRACERWRASGVQIEVVRRSDRQGYKAGALANGTAVAQGDVLAVFDADFVPPPHFLERVVPYLEPPVAAVQARWGHLNADLSGLTRAQAMALDGHFVVEKAARSRLGLFLKFNGTAGVWSREALEAAGGWQGDTLSEDTDLSYRAQMAGWRLVYLPQVVVPGELPVTLQAYKRQQRRWAAGTTGVLKKLGPQLLKAELPLAVRVHALLGLAEHFMHPLTLTVLLASPLLLFYAVPFHAAFLFVAIMTLSPSAMYVVALSRLYDDWPRRVLSYPLLMLLALGLSLNGTFAVFRSLAGRSGPFERTPKLGDWRVGDGTGQRRAASLASGTPDEEPNGRHPQPAPTASAGELADAGPRRLSQEDILLAGEIGLFVYAALGLALAVHRSTWSLVPLFALFSAGFFSTAVLTLLGRRSSRSPSYPWRGPIRASGSESSQCEESPEVRL